MGQSKPFSDSFDPHQIDLIERVLERAWSVIQLEPHGNSDEARSLLSISIMNQVRAGEDISSRSSTRRSRNSAGSGRRR
jgi:hypothetical protein